MSKAQKVSIGPAMETNTALPLNVSKSVRIGPATETDTAMPISPSLAGAAVMKASATVIGPQSSPQAETLSEGVGVLSWVMTVIALGYGMGSSIGDIPGGAAGAAVGGVAACATIRWRPARELAFRFIRWLNGKGQ